MCTTGAKVLTPGREFVLFKNRDFKRDHFEDRLSLTDTAFGVLSLETHNSIDTSHDRFSGFSIGCNRDLICCDSNVKTVGNGENYDRLVQAVVENTQTVDEAIQCVRDLVEQNDYSWANMLVATPSEVAAIEVRDGRIAVERAPQFIARSNHHICLGVNPDDDDVAETAIRYELANEGLRKVAGLDDVFALVRTHAPGLEYGICRHGTQETVYSYVVHWRDREITFYACQGHPCEGGEFVKIPITFDIPNSLRMYPSNRAI
jgi:hypothetical protein